MKNSHTEKPFYETIGPFDSGFLEVGDGHQVYYEQWGNVEGLPVVFCHGGPGACVQPKHRKYFDHKKHRVVLFDQRGCGKSTPTVSLENNTSAHLVADMEKLRQHLDIEKWMVFGGSWGSTLSLLYAEAHPSRVLGMVIYGVWLANKWMTEWFTSPEGAGRFFPDKYEEYKNGVAGHTPLEVSQNVLKRLKEGDKKAGVQSMEFEGYLCGMEANVLQERKQEAGKLTGAELEEKEARDTEMAYRYSLILNHYTTHHNFLEEDQILAHAPRLENIPLSIIQGRYDMVCPPAGAWALHKAVPSSTLEFVPHAGHSGSEMFAEIHQAVMKMTEKIS